MDINIPDIDGYSLTSKIRTLSGFSDVPIIALTANVMRGDRERSLEAGCNGYIQKPVDIDLLPQQIERFIRK
jgi:two-component system cell cycle response regulator DivK